MIIASVAVGLWAGAFIVAFSWGMYQQHIREVIDSQLSHLQLHQKDYEEDQEVKAVIPGADTLMREILSMKNIKAVSGRLVISGMLTSPTGVSGIRINGIVPEHEKKVTTISSKVVEGNYLDSTVRNPVLLGERLAQKLKVKLKNKIVLTFQDKEGNITAGAFRITGIYRTSNSTVDELNVYVRLDDLSSIAGIPGGINEVAVLLPDNDPLAATDAALEKKHPALRVQTWKELSPELELVVDSFRLYMYIFISIILLALMFGIVNIMLMAVLERTRELGMLMAIGMNKSRIFFTIILETLFLVAVGGPLGLLLAWTTVQWTGHTGIDISAFGKGLAAYGFSPVIHPGLDRSYYFTVSLMTVSAALLSAIYPALRAIRLRPTEAIQKI